MHRSNLSYVLLAVSALSLYVLPSHGQNNYVSDAFGHDNYFSDAFQLVHVFNQKEFSARIVALQNYARKGFKEEDLNRELSGYVEAISTELLEKNRRPHPSGPPSSTLPSGGGSQTPGPDPYDTMTPSTGVSALDTIELAREIRTALLIGIYDSAEDKPLMDGLIGLNETHSFHVLFEAYNSPSGVGNTKAPDSFFGIDQAELINGITGFVIKRAKQQMVSVYLNHWYEALQGDRVIAPLLPQTLSTFHAFNEDLSVAKYGDKWKVAFREDLGNIPKRFQDTAYVGIVLQKLGITSHVRDYQSLISGGDELIYNLYLKKHLVKVLETMANRYASGDASDTRPIFERLVIAASSMLQICGSMSDNNETYNPVKLDDLKKMNPKSINLLFRLIYIRQQRVLLLSWGSRGMEFFQGTSNNPDDPLMDHLKELITVISAYQSLLSGFRSNAQIKNQLTFDDARKLLELTFQVFDAAAVMDPSGALAKDDAVITPFYNHLVEMGEGMATKQYGKVVDGAIGMLTQLHPTGDTMTLVRLQKVSSFMLNILSSSSAVDVEAALDELIPKGQFQLKNISRFSVSLSAYPGIIGGTEMIKRYPDGDDGAIPTRGKQPDWKGSLGAYLPIGIDLSWGDYHNRKKRFGSWNVFLQALDFGSVLNYRLSGDSTESPNPNITFQQLLSGGISIMRHFNNSPLVAGINAAYTPELRKIKGEAASYQPNAFRLGVFLAVDVTGVIFHTRKE